MLIIASTFTADLMCNPLTFLLKKFCSQKVQFIYNQVFQQLLVTNSEFNNNNDGINILLIRLSDMFKFQKNNKFSNEIDSSLDELVQAITMLHDNMKVPLLMVITPSQIENMESSKFYNKIESKLKLELNPLKGVNLITSSEYLSHNSDVSIFNNFTEKHGHIPYTIQFYTSLSIILAKKYYLLSKKPYKVIVLDCDNTLWDGIVEEDGIEKIKINKTEYDLQKFMIERQESGFLLTLCSKNSEGSVLSVFQKHGDMLINLKKHICGYRINWQSKSNNIKSLAKELNLGLDSFIFIDDNKIECAEVRSAIPEILVVELPKDKGIRLNYLKNIWAFDSLENGYEDKNRTTFYKQNTLRSKLKYKSHSYLEFIKKLNIKTDIKKAGKNDFQRITQLNQRTNQFNLNPQSIKDIEFNKRINGISNTCLIVKAKDKFGDYGLVGVAVYDLLDNELQLKTFFLSCRILGRGIEFDIMKYLYDIAEKEKISNIRVFFKKTEKNIPGMRFIQKISEGDNLDNKNSILISTNNLEKSTFMTEENLGQISEIASKSPVSVISNDFLLEIANKYSTPEKLISALIKKEKIGSKENNICPIGRNINNIFQRNGIKNNQINASFVELGIDSIKCVLIASEIYQDYTIEINPFDLLKDDITIKEFAENLIYKIKNECENLVRTAKNDDPVDFLSFPQKRIWFEEKLSPGSSKNNIFSAYETNEDIDIQAMTNTVMFLLERHDALRMSFLEKNNEPLFTIRPLSEIQFNINKLFFEDDSILIKFLDEFKSTPFDLQAAPLIRVSIVKTKHQSTLFLICIHHIIHDGWSLSIFLKELNILYNSFVKKITPSLPSKSITYADFIALQNSRISEDVISRQKKYWKEILYKMPKLEIIYDKINHSDLSNQPSQRINFKINAKLTKKLKKIAAKNRVTLYDVLVSAFSILLSHYTNQNDVHFLTATSGRNSSQISNTIGFFVNLLLLRIKLTENETFTELLRKNKKLLDNILSNQDLSLNEIFKLTGENVNSKTHLFSQVGFVFQNYPIESLSINNSKSTRVYSDDQAALLYDSCNECRFGNLVCFMQEFNLELHGLWEFNTNLFNKRTIKNVISAFKTLLENIAANSTEIVNNIPLLNNAKREMILNKWNSSSTQYSDNVSLLSYFNEQVVIRPNALAVKHNNLTISYLELDRKSNQLARALNRLGVTIETPVGICLPKGIGRIVAMVGILKSGGCYVPLEEDIPTSRINYIIEDTGIPLIIIENESLPWDETIAVKTLSITDHSINLESDLQLNDSIPPRHLAYILYTSGSTGKPKGVMIEQKGIIRLVKFTNYIKFTPSDRVAQTSNFLFDAATFEIWGALLNGSSLILIDKNTLLDSELLLQFLKNEKISILFLTTQLFHAYAFNFPHLFCFLKYIITGGEAVLAEAVKNILDQKNSPKYFINGYGPTENTTFSTAYVIKSSKSINTPIPIGKPINGTQVYILDKNFNPKTIGAPGKLYLGGLGLARQYINLNSEKFISPLNKHNISEKLYDTGDVAVWQPDGNLKFIGRSDNQIKLNGYRVELSEIEIQLENHPLVEQAIVLSDNNSHHKNILAYIVLKNGYSLYDINLHHYLKTILPSYMIPIFYFQVHTLPITENGKVDRKMLANMQLEPVNYNEHVAPQNSLQESLILIYERILNIHGEKISINSDFFDLGGTSILAISLINSINEKFKIKINFEFLYENSTVKQLSNRINYLLNGDTFSLLEESNYPENVVLKKIKQGDDEKNPIVFIHPIGGTGFCYLELIKTLPHDQTCYVVQDPSIEANKVLFDSIPSMAAYYNDLILSQIESKKIILAGFSFGGMLCLEMVAQLEKKQRDHYIDHIISFDTWVVSDFMNTEAREALKSSILQQYEKVMNSLINENIDPKPWMQLYYNRLQDLGFIYQPTEIKKRIVLFKAMQQSGEFAAMEHSSNFLSLHTKGQVTVHRVPGDHDTILKPPNVRYIVKIMNSYLTQEKMDIA